MTAEIWIAIISGVFSFAGVVITVLWGNKKTQKQNKENSDLIIYRVEQLEKKQDKHNSIMERVFMLEKVEAVHDEEIKVANNRIKDLEAYHK